MSVSIWSQSSRTLKPTCVYDAFWRFAAERQNIFVRRIRGEPPPWTNDRVLMFYRFTNAYRASDRVSQYLIRNVIYDSAWSPEDVLVRVLLFKFFNRIETWELLARSGIAITADGFNVKTVGKVLEGELRKNRPIYSSAYIMPPGSDGARYKHETHLRLIAHMHRDKAARRLQECATMRDAYGVLRRYPLLGPFLAYQLVTDINYSELTNFTEMEFTQPGPGARSGIKKCFVDIGSFSEADIIRYTAETQEEQFRKRGLNFRGLPGRPLQLIDVQNLFCEIDKYARVEYPAVEGIGHRARIKQKFSPISNELSIWYPPKWGINEKLHAS